MNKKQKGLRRSWLYVPASKEKWYENLSKYDADVFVLDLEDSVPQHSKNFARETLLKCNSAIPDDKEFFVRINAVQSVDFSKDIQIIPKLVPKLDGIALPKIRNPKEVKILEKAIENTNLEIVPIIEVLEGERNVYQIVKSSKRINFVQWGETGDYSLDFGLFNDYLDAMFHPIATHFACNVVKCCKINEKPILDGAYLNIRDINGLEKKCNWAIGFGFDGKAALHPLQLSTINRVFTVDESKIQKAEEIISIYENAVGSSCIPYGSSFIAEPQYKSAKRFLERSKSC